MLPGGRKSGLRDYLCLCSVLVLVANKVELDRLEKSIETVEVPDFMEMWVTWKPCLGIIITFGPKLFPIQSGE